MKFQRSFNLGFVLALGLVSSLGTACGGGETDAPLDSDPCSSSDSAADQQVSLTPRTIHTGVNGRDTYKAVLIGNIGSFQMATNDPTVVTIDRTGCLPNESFGIIAELTAVGAGETTVRIVSGEFSRRTRVNVTEYTTDQFDLGDERYNNPSNENTTDRIACFECHQSGVGGAPHSPSALGGTDDAALVTAITTSKYPDTCERESGGTCNCTPSNGSCASCSESCSLNEGYELDLRDFGGGPGSHTYDLTDAEAIGILAYMRALEPEGL